MAYVAMITRADGYVVPAEEWNKVPGNFTALRAGEIALTSQAVGDLVVATSASQFGRVADVATGQVLVSGGVATAPAYSASPTVTALTAATLTSTGQVVISGASAGQIVFPATQNASANANTLDDYEEGTWTPVIGGSGGTSGQTYTYQVGSYVKIGKLVIAQFDVSASNKGTITTSVQIQGLPFTSENTSNQNWAAKIFYNTGAGGTGLLECCGLLAPNVTAMDVYGSSVAVSVQVVLTTANLDTACRFAGVVMYRATA